MAERRIALQAFLEEPRRDILKEYAAFLGVSLSTFLEALAQCLLERQDQFEQAMTALGVEKIALDIEASRRRRHHK